MIVLSGGRRSVYWCRPVFLYKYTESIGVLELLGIAWSAWKLSAKRLGPYSGAVFALVTVVAFVFLREYLAENYPRLGEALNEIV